MAQNLNVWCRVKHYKSHVYMVLCMWIKYTFKVKDKDLLKADFNEHEQFFDIWHITDNLMLNNSIEYHGLSFTKNC